MTGHGAAWVGPDRGSVVARPQAVLLWEGRRLGQGLSPSRAGTQSWAQMPVPPGPSCVTLGR